MWILFPADTHIWIGDAIGWYLRGMLMSTHSVDTHVSINQSINQAIKQSSNQSINQSINHVIFHIN